MSKPFILGSNTNTTIYYKLNDQDIAPISRTGFAFDGTPSTKLYIIGKKKLKINLAPLFNYIPSTGASILIYESPSLPAETATPCMLQVSITDGSYFFYYPDPTTGQSTVLSVDGVVVSADSYFDKIKKTLSGKYADGSIPSVGSSHISMWVWLVIIIIAIVVSSVITFYVTRIKMK